MSDDAPHLDFDPPEAPRTTVVAQAPLPGRCRNCGTALTGRQEAFCSKACNARWWDMAHPRINRGPTGPREGTIKALILGFLADGEWRSKREIADAIRAFEHSVGSRISELQRDGHRIETDARNGCSTRAHRFRLVRG